LTATTRLSRAGTPYTVRSLVRGSERINWGVADRAGSSGPVPTVLYCHGAGGNSRQFESLTAWQALREWMLDSGWAWIECTGGGRHAWGNSRSRIAYEHAVVSVASRLPIGRIVVLGRSMGGIVAQWLLTRSTIVGPRCAGVIVNSGIQDLSAAYRSGLWITEMRSAYQASDDRAFATASSGHDPLRFDPHEWSGRRVLQLVASDDRLAPPAEHGLAIREHYRGMPLIDELDVRLDGDHSRERGCYAQVEPMIRFLSNSADWHAAQSGVPLRDGPHRRASTSSIMSERTS